MRIGIVGGGQLGKMMALKAKKMGFSVVVLDPSPDAPAGQVADRQIVGGFYDEKALRELVESVDVATFDIEHVDVGVLKELAREGRRIFPPPGVLEVVQDKLSQKSWFRRAGIPVPEFEAAELTDFLERGRFPFVQKARRGGYDGRGVVVFKDRSDLPKALRTEYFLEEFLDLEKELAVMVARGAEGDVRCYPVVEMAFDERANICDMVVAPARVAPEVAEEARRIAVKAVEALGGVGVFGVELFLARDGRVLVNEVAPRPHNSGHYTIEACVTCQFEQHIRAVTGLPLGSTRLLSPAVMVNLLGEEGGEGAPLIEGLTQALAIPGASFHFYGKPVTRPFRKMGHVTILDENLERALEHARRVKGLLKVRAEAGK